MNDDEVVYELLYRVLIEVRFAAREGDPRLPKIAHYLTDLMHNVPSMIISVRNGRQGGCSSYGEILEYLSARAEAMGMTPWLTNAIKHIKEKEVSIRELHTLRAD